MKINNIFKHIKVIMKHKYFVFMACKDTGIIWRGIKHDLSKFSPIEFYASVKYFQEHSSPIDAEKKEKGYSLAWQHHKRNNSHHWEYWLDYINGELITIRVPFNDLLEMVCDYIGAGKAYNVALWTNKTPLQYWNDNKHKYHLHTDTEKLLNLIFSDIKRYGWKCIKYNQLYYKYLYELIEHNPTLYDEIKN